MTHDDLIDKHNKILKSAGYLEINEGWYKIIDDLCTRLQDLTEREHPQVKAVQIKEKYGSLCFYTEGEVSNYQLDLINLAISVSDKTCQVCGNPGKLETNGGWFRTVCEEHRQ